MACCLQPPRGWSANEAARARAAGALEFMCATDPEGGYHSPAGAAETGDAADGFLSSVPSESCMADGTNLPRNIGAPATRALTAAGYSSLEQLNGVPATELEKLHGVGPRAIRLLEEALREHGHALG